MKSIIFLALILTSFSAKADKITYATGFGATKEEALFDAKKKAISKALGEYIESRLEVSNGKVTQNSIAAVNGVVNRYEEIGQYENNKIEIKAYVDNNYIDVFPAKGENRRKINVDAVNQLMENYVNHQEIFNNLFKDPSEVYDVTITKVTPNIKRELYTIYKCYDIEYDVETNKKWYEKYKLVRSKFKNALIRRFGKEGYPYVESSKIRMVDIKNNFEIHGFRGSFGDPVNGNQKFFYGKKIEYSFHATRCIEQSKKQPKDFGLSFKLVNNSRDNYLSKFSKELDLNSVGIKKDSRY